MSTLARRSIIVKSAVILIFSIAASIHVSVNVARVVDAQTGSGSLNAPSNVSATDNVYASKIGVEWSTVRGAAVYRIFRNTVNDLSTATEIGSTPANSFFDSDAVAGQTFFYWVRSENGALIGGTSASTQGIRAIGSPQGPVPPQEPPPMPPANQVTAAKIELGKALFWDEQLSSTRTVSCGTCHITSRGGSDPRTLASNLASRNPGPDGVFNNADDILASPGVPITRPDGTFQWSSIYGIDEQVTARKANSTINAAYSPTLFWDGRATPTFRDPLTNTIVINAGGALESQSIEPPTSGVEMGHTGRDWVNVAERISGSKPLVLSPHVPADLNEWIGGRSYPDLFLEAFGSPGVTPVRIAMAIATYQRTLFSDQTPFDRAAGGIQPLTAQEQRGRGVFNQVSCNVCHAGTNFTNNAFINIGIRPQNEDTGRFQVTGNPLNIAEFRVPSLRNVELRAPYMHNGRFETLEQVVDFYDRGGDFPNAPNFPSNLVQPRNLTAGQKADLVAFLKRPLTDTRVANETGKFARPALYTESDRVPTISGTGTAGTDALVPEIHAISPPLLGNPNFIVSLSNALPGSEATLVISGSDPGNSGTVPPYGTFSRVTAAIETASNGRGYASVNISLPSTRALAGRTFYGRWYVPDPAAQNGLAVSRLLTFKLFGDSSSVVVPQYVDFDGDRKTDVSVYRPIEGNWYVFRSSDKSVSIVNFGLPTDRLTPGDFDGDGRTDHAVFRDGIWYLLRSTAGFAALQFGLAGDIPQPGDYDGDGSSDLAVFRPNDRTWYILGSRDGFRAAQFGLPTDKAVAADYDGDGRFDLAVYRDGVWYVQRSQDGFMAIQFGLPDDRPVIGDYDGDGRSDIAVWRPGNGVWHLLKSSDRSYSSVQFGLSNDSPSPGDYDGDGISDLGIYRPDIGTWFVYSYGTGSVRIQQFGVSSDLSVPASNVP